MKPWEQINACKGRESFIWVHCVWGLPLPDGENAIGVLKSQRRGRGHVLATPRCLIGLLEMILLLFAPGKLRLMKSFQPPVLLRICTG